MIHTTEKVFQLIPYNQFYVPYIMNLTQFKIMRTIMKALWEAVKINYAT